jgi:hypothetical protein
MGRVALNPRRPRREDEEGTDLNEERPSRVRREVVEFMMLREDGPRERMDVGRRGSFVGQRSE